MDIFSNPGFDPDWVLDDAEDNYGIETEQEPTIGEHWDDKSPEEK